MTNHLSPIKEHPHVPAAFINALADEGTKAEAIESLQKQWNENCALRAELKALRAPAQSALPQTLTGEIACVLEDCGPAQSQSPEALAELIRHYQPTWSRIVCALTSAHAPAQCAPMREALELIKKQVIERGSFTIERGSGAMTVIANALSSDTSTQQRVGSLFPDVGEQDGKTP